MEPLLTISLRIWCQFLQNLPWIEQKVHFSLKLIKFSSKMSGNNNSFLIIIILLILKIKIVVVISPVIIRQVGYDLWVKIIWFLDNQRLMYINLNNKMLPIYPYKINKINFYLFNNKINNKNNLLHCNHFFLIIKKTLINNTNQIS